MRIALFHNLPSGGAKRAVYEWMRRLVRSHQVDVYTLSTADHGFCDVRPLARSHEEYEFTPGRLFESPLGRLNQLQRWRDLRRLVRLGREIAEQVDRERYDAVLANTCLLTAVPVVLQFLKTPAVYFLHEPVGRAHEPLPVRTAGRRGAVRARMDGVDPLIALYRRRLDALQTQNVLAPERLVANSAFTQAAMQQAYGVTPVVCRYGVDADLFRPFGDSRREAHVLSVGELSPRKGFDFLIEALALIPRRTRPTLVIAANASVGQERRYLEQLAAGLGVTLEIRVGLGSESLVDEYNRAAFCVYAPVREPFGLVPLEAMACGTAVVAVREGGVPESVVHERTGLLVDRRPAAFAGAVERLLSSPSLAARYGRDGREHVLANWTWDRSVSELERHLGSCGPTG